MEVNQPEELTFSPDSFVDEMAVRYSSVLKEINKLVKCDQTPRDIMRFLLELANLHADETHGSLL